MKQAVIFGLILLLIIGAGILTLTIQDKGIYGGENVERAASRDTIFTGNETPEELQRLGNPDAPTSSGKTNGGGTGGGSTTGSGSKNQCTKQISYSLGTFNSEQTCDTTINQTCTQTTVNCSTEVSNFDQEVGGEFSLRFTHSYINGTTEVQLQNTTNNITVGPQEIQTAWVSKTFNGIEANNTISCTTNTIYVPRSC